MFSSVLKRAHYVRTHGPDGGCTLRALGSPPQVTVTSIAVASCFLVASAVAIPTVRFFAIHMGVQMLFHLILLHLMLLPMM